MTRSAAGKAREADGGSGKVASVHPQPFKVESAHAPTTTPPFTLADIRRAIPSHCFKRSLVRSFAHLLVDVALCSALAWAATFIDAAPAPLPWLLWPVYWFLQVLIQ
jgi:omega-6 fatty acid desaturase / acyl-lipid omega-6 desaturase (Delta-12 desaturase)